MEILQESPTTSLPLAKSRGRSWLWLGIGLCILGQVLFFVQVFQLKNLVTPWYQPILATAGVLLALVSVRQRPTWIRIVAVLLLALWAGTGWFFLLSISRLPEYKGPVEIGRMLPEFTTTLADGKPFTSQDLQQGIPTVLVFYRGHW
jgi:hypothetical protein